MGLVEQTAAFISAIESADWDKVSSMLSDDFKFYGPAPQPLDRTSWVAFQQALSEAFPNWSFHLSKVELHGDNDVSIKVRISGTHSQDLQLPDPDFRPLSATGTILNLPVENAKLKFHDGKIKELFVEEGAKGGFPAVIEQLLDQLKTS